MLILKRFVTKKVIVYVMMTTEFFIKFLDGIPHVKHKEFNI
jgi:hypothetical protein